MGQSGGFNLSHRLKPLRWCVFISGRGSNLAAAMEAAGEINSNRVELVVATSESVSGCAKARRAGIPILVAPCSANGKIDWEQLSFQLERRRIDLIFLLGFMKIVPKLFIDRWEKRIVNLHPSLLPKFPGLQSIEKAYVAKDDIGVTVHLVVPEVDAGRVLKQRKTIGSEQQFPQRLFAESFAEFKAHVDEQRLVKDIVQQAAVVRSFSREGRK